jgi:hypothetical protein
MSAPGRADADRAISYALQQKARGDAAADPAVQRDCFKQAAQALGNAARIMDALASAIAPPEPAPTPVLSFGAPGHPKVFAPGPR